MVNPDRNLYDPPYDDALLYDTEMEPERPRSRSLIVMLAFVVLAAFAGVVWVAYNQGVQMGQRGVNPPVLTADPGPVRVEPIQTAENGVNPAPEKSYERLWAGESTEPTSGQVQPQPGADREVPTSQDVVGQPATGRRAIAEPPATGGPEDVRPIEPGMDATVELTGNLPGEEIPSSGPAMTQLNMDRPTRMAKAGREDVTGLLPQASGSSGPVVEDSTTPSVSRPSVTQAAPSAVRPVKPIAPTPIAPPAPEIQSAPEPAAIAAPEQAAPASSGGATIQLGSFPSSALAAAQWSKVKGANQELLGTYSPQIVEASIPGKGVWYRLRVGGFADKSAAKGVCQQLSAAGQACILAGK
jgi:cell division septation protein DedD